MTNLDSATKVLARGTGGLATTLDLSPYAGSQAGLEFRRHTPAH
jgi:hypothetical protein